MEKKKRFGDRKDGALIRDLDAMHFVVPLLYPNRCDNEAYISERVELTNLNAYLERKNAGETEFPYTMFHVILAALVKTLTLRPKLNRFIANKNMYQRNEVSASFVVKKKFSDNGGDTIDTIHESIRSQVMFCRSGKKDRSTDSMEFFTKLPRFVSKAAVHFVTFLDRHGWCPKVLIATDPSYASVIISNLGSIKLKSGYHHLTNWGTCSLFCIIGEKGMNPVFSPDGTYVMRETLDLGLTIDERLADGYYYSKSIRLLKKLLENPELLEKPMNEEAEY